MSWHGHWRLEALVREHSRSTGVTRHVALEIAIHADSQSGVTSMTLRELSDCTGHHVDTVTAAVADWKALGEVDTDRSNTGTGRRTVYRIRVDVLDALPMKHPWKPARSVPETRTKRASHSVPEIRTKPRAVMSEKPDVSVLDSGTSLSVKPDGFVLPVIPARASPETQRVRERESAAALVDVDIEVTTRDGFAARSVDHDPRRLHATEMEEAMAAARAVVHRGGEAP